MIFIYDGDIWKRANNVTICRRRDKMVYVFLWSQVMLIYDEATNL
mgnify:CR=1